MIRVTAALLLPLLALSSLAAAEGIESWIAPAGSGNSRNSEGDVIVLKDGALLAAWSDFYGGNEDEAAARISASRSSDGGRTWPARYTLQENIGKQNVMSASLLRERSGDILFFFCVKNSGTDLYPMVRRSHDEGRTWSAPVRIVPERGYYGMNNGRVIQLRSGRILCPVWYSLDVFNEREPIRTVSYYSDDSGRTWIRGKGITDCPRRGAMEPGFVELKDGRLLQIIRTQTGQIWYADSRDGGDTWTAAAPWTVATPEAPSTVLLLPPDGEMLLIYNPLAPGTNQRYPLLASISRDQGKTWLAPRAIESDPASHQYEYVSATPHQGSLLLTYDVGRRGGNWLKFRSVPLEWLRGR
ncbi:MAG: sialidase family protein [Acidobacteria bacterium]|nr:sialidase family protein [Acidobacteriota bacterium]